MRLGMVGLGRMGGNMAARLRAGGHEVVGYSLNSALSDVPSLDELIERLPAPRVVWLMVPAGDATEQTLEHLAASLSSGDVVVDGGNSNFRHSMRKAALFAERGIDFVDAGTSGGIGGLEEGYCLMVGGTPEAVGRIQPALTTLAPENGWAHVGPSGAGHFVKMVHNGIEYGLLQAYAEGLDILRGSAEFDVDLHQVAEVWRHGSVVRSWLLDLAVRALADDPNLERVAGYVDDSGEGRWTLIEAIGESVPSPAVAAALFARFASRRDDSFAMKVIAALRREFGGHAVKEE
ncbi:MAG: decarboxylating 6-phosphogluconate dehydrogenase [Actinomycetota bacterium]